MTNSKDVFNDLVTKIQLEEPPGEIQSIVYLLLNKFTGLTRTQIRAGKHIASLNTETLELLIARINQHEPIQYVLGEAHFFGRDFSVDSSVLIPRPETEQVVAEVLARSLDSPNPQILDLGTGSGCLAITLALELPQATVTATDVSKTALTTAGSNAKQHAANVTFFKHDLLYESLPLTSVDIIVSNPPYITPSEKKNMSRNVLAYEPELALFVPENNPLVFYNAIASLAKEIVSSKGFVVVEINEMFGDQVASIFAKNGFLKTETKRDLDGKNRVVIASR